MQLSSYGADGAVGNPSSCPPRFVSSYGDAYATCCRVFPALATISITSPPPGTAAAAFADAYAAVLHEHNFVSTETASLDADRRYWVDGTVHSAFHPRHPTARSGLPELAHFLDGPSGDIRSRCEQRAVPAPP